MNTIRFGQFLGKSLLPGTKHAMQINARALSSGNKFTNVQVNSKTGVATVIMQRPPVNSLSLELVTELTNTVIEIEKNKGKGLIITSAVPGVFTAGLDLMELYPANPARLKAYWTAVQDMWLNLYSAGFSTVAAISGHAPGGGCLISCSCDYRIMVEGNHTIGLNETQLGLVAPTWFVDTFRNVLPKRVSELALISGKLFNVKEALNVGLIDEVASSNEEALEKAAAYIAKLSGFSMHAMAQTKLTIRYDAVKRLQDNREHDLRVFTKFVSSPEIQKGLEMYLELLKKKK